MSVAAIRGREGVEAAIRGAAQATGVDFDFLLRTARRESSLNPGAKAKTSSAAGLFQFVEQTWLSMVKTHGARHGYARYADMVERGAGGRLTVSAENRGKVLDLRYDATAASLMAGELASDHAAYLRGRLGREPTGGELYVAHFLGPAGSAKLIRAAEQTPGATAAGLFPAAARANRSIFYASGEARSVAAVYANLTRTAPATPAAPAAVARVAAAVAEPIVRAITPPPIRAVVAAVTQAASGADALRSALSRADQARRSDLLIDMILGDGRGASPLSPELLTLLSAARER